MHSLLATYTFAVLPAGTTSMAISSVEIGRELKEKLVRIVVFLEGAEELFKKGVEGLDLRDEHGEKYIAGVKSLLKFNQRT